MKISQGNLFWMFWKYFPKGFLDTLFLISSAKLLHSIAGKQVPSSPAARKDLFTHHLKITLPFFWGCKMVINHEVD